ncbi:hypothetical protein [Kibdelosporangium aridum]|nr:hypothetical protein [Kibdelosporangium aridum]
MSGSEYSASLSAALNSYWQALEVRWTKEAGKTLYGGTAAVPAAPEPVRWQVPPDSWRHLTTACKVVAWAMNDGTPENRPNECDGWSVPDARYVECKALDVFRQVGDWAWAKREQLSRAVPDLAAGPELSFLEEAHGTLRSIGVAMRSEGSVGDHALTGAVDRMAIGQNDNANRAWLTGWTGLAANSLKGGFLSTVKPTLVNQAALCDWLASCYSVRGTVIHATRNNILNVIGHLTRELGEVIVTPVDLSKPKLVVSYASQVWTIAQITFEVLKNVGAVGTVLGLVDFALGKSDSVTTEYKYAQMSDFFALVDTSVRTLHSEMDSAEAEYAKAVNAINAAIASVDRTTLELYDITQHSPDGDDSDPNASARFAVDVNVVLQIAQDCYEAAEGYSQLLNKLATTSYSDGQLAGRGLTPIAADQGVIELREDIESFFSTTTTRYLTAADRIKAAAKLYVQNDEAQRERYNKTISEWRKLGLGEFGQRNRIDTDPDKEGVQN